MSSRVLIAIVAGLVAAPAAATIAAGLPAVEASQYTAFYGGASNEIQNYTLGSVGDASRSASSMFAPNAEVSVSAAPGYMAVARLSYSFFVSGPIYGTIVPLIAYARLSATLTGAGQVDASLNIANNCCGSYQTSVGRTTFAQGTASFDGPLHFDAITGITGTINLNANVISFGGTGSAFADPYIVIDPTFAAIDPGYVRHYALSFSDGAGNVGPAAAVPEPASWALLIAGFAATGVAARRRRPVTMSC